MCHLPTISTTQRHTCLYTAGKIILQTDFEFIAYSTQSFPKLLAITSGKSFLSILIFSLNEVRFSVTSVPLHLIGLLSDSRTKRHFIDCSHLRHAFSPLSFFVLNFLVLNIKTISDVYKLLIKQSLQTAWNYLRAFDGHPTRWYCWNWLEGQSLFIN